MNVMTWCVLMRVVSRELSIRWAIEMAMAMYESQITDRRVKFPLERREHPLLSL